MQEADHSEDFDFIDLEDNTSSSSVRSSPSTRKRNSSSTEGPIEMGSNISKYSLVSITRHGTFIWYSSFIRLCIIFWNCEAVLLIGWIHSQFRSTSGGTFDKNNLPPILCTVYRSVLFTCSMPWGVSTNTNWNMYSNWNWRIAKWALGTSSVDKYTISKIRPKALL